ncbi:MAG: hypothetical protein V3R99_07265 [Thermoguttaceae bacterium]
MVPSTQKPVSEPVDSTDRHTWDAVASYRAAVLIGLAALLLAVGLAFSPNRNGRDGSVTLAVGGSAPGKLSQDEQLRRAAIGTWQDFHHGKRTMTLREDGTATMVVELTGIKARLFTPRLQLDIVWSVEDGRMKRRTVGGTPADKVAFVNRRAGKQVAEPILELTGNRLRLLDRDGKTKYDWRRVR